MFQKHDPLQMFKTRFRTLSSPCYQQFGVLKLLSRHYIESGGTKSRNWITPKFHKIFFLKIDTTLIYPGIWRNFCEIQVRINKVDDFQLSHNELKCEIAVHYFFIKKKKKIRLVPLLPNAMTTFFFIIWLYIRKEIVILHTHTHQCFVVFLEVRWRE